MRQKTIYYVTMELESSNSKWLKPEIFASLIVKHVALPTSMQGAWDKEEIF